MCKIKESIFKYKNVAYICNSLSQFKYFIELCELEGIEFSKMGFREKNIYETFSDGLSIDDRPVAMMCLVNKEDWAYRPSGQTFTHPDRTASSYVETDIPYEIQFYRRPYSKWYGYGDCNNYTLLDFSQYIREEKLEQLGI